MNNNVVSVIDPNIKLKITINIVEIITPAFQAHAFPLNVSYEKIRNMQPKISNAVVRKNVPKNNIAFKTGDNISGCWIIYTERLKEYIPMVITILPNSIHNKINGYRILGLSLK